MEFHEPVAVNSENVAYYINLLSTEDDLKPHVRQLIKLCIYCTRSKRDVAEKWIQKTIEIAIELDRKNFHAAGVMQYASFYYYGGDYKNSKKYYINAIPLLQNDPNGLTILYATLANIAHHENDKEASIAYYEKAIKYGNKCENAIFHVTQAKLNQALVLQDFNQFQKATEIIYEVIKDLDETDSSHIKYFAVAESNLATINEKLGKMEESIKLSRKSLERRILLKLPNDIAIDKVLLAGRLFKINSYEEAFEFVNEALETHNASNNKLKAGEALLMRSKLFKKFGDNNLAYEDLILANEYFNNSDDTILMITGLIALSELTIELEKVDESEKNLKIALELIGETELNELQAKACLLLSNVYEAKGDLEQCLHYIKQHLDLNAKIYQEDVNRNVAEMEAKYESAKKEQKAQKLELEKVSFEQKALRAQMNPHFIFNTLNSIKKYVDVQDNKTASTYLVSFSKLMRRILENSDDEFVLIEDVVEFLKEYIRLEQMRCNYSFTYQIIVDDEIEEDLMQIPSMIVQPYLENAIIHGIAGETDGRIELHFDLVDEETICCKIIDNGKGIDSKKEKSFQSQHRSMGTKITQERIAILAQKHNKQVKVEKTDLSTKNSTGTEVKIYLPIL